MAPEPAVTSGTPTHEVLALLPFPEGLSNAQREGHVCVWGGETLTAKTAIDLGSRRLDDVMAFPRGCRSCVSRAALVALFDHSAGPHGCLECAEGPICTTGRALNRVIRMGRR